MDIPNAKHDRDRDHEIRYFNQLNSPWVEPRSIPDDAAHVLNAERKKLKRTLRDEKKTNEKPL